MIRQIRDEDIQPLKEIHAKFFANEFSFDDFIAPALSQFLVTDESDKIISAGSIRPIAEMVAITNFDQSPRMRRAALYDMLQIAHFVLRNTQMHQLHAFVQDSKWESQLIRAGFSRCVGKPVFINVG